MKKTAVKKTGRKTARCLAAAALLACLLFSGGVGKNALAQGCGGTGTNPGNSNCVPNNVVDFGCPGRGASNPYCGEEPSPPPRPLAGCGSRPTTSALDFPDHLQLLIDLLRENWISSLMMMTEQFTVNMMYQMLILGTFIDAQNQIETQLVFRDLQAQSNANYHSSTQMCRFGTGVRSLAASDMRARQNARLLHKTMQDRQVMAKYSASGIGEAGDYQTRIDQFGKIYCNLSESFGEIEPMCKNYTAPAGDNPPRIGNDIDFTRMVDQKYTIDIDFEDASATDGDQQREAEAEEDIIALSKNLYGTPGFTFQKSGHLATPDGLRDYMAVRSVLAIRSVAMHSFASIVGMKAKGAGSAAPFLKRIFSETSGIENIDEINEIMGENPSYYAQMEVLTNTMYQNPVFYTNLYDKPENVTRMSVAMEAVKLMHDRDRFLSAQRRELMASLVLELKLREHQDKVNVNKIRRLRDRRYSGGG